MSTEPPAAGGAIATADGSAPSGPRGELTESLLRCISRAQRDFIIDIDPRQVFGRLLEDVLSLTSSEYGFIGEIEHDSDEQPFLRTWAITNIAWTTELTQWYEEESPSGIVFENLDTLFGTVIRTGEPVIANTPAHDPRSGGLPEGHPRLDAFLGLPFLLGERLIGMVGLANRPGGYDDDLIAQLQPFLTTCSTIIAALQGRRDQEASRAQLQISEARTTAILQSVVDAVVVIDEDGSIETFNRAAEQTFGYSAAEVLGRNVTMLMVDEDAVAHTNQLARYKETGERRVIGRERQVVGRRRDGSTFPLELSVCEVVVQGQRLFAGTCRDLTEKQEAERDIRMYAATIEATPDFVGVARVDGQVLAINRAGRRQIGLDPDAPLEGVSIGDIHAPWSRTLIRDVGLPTAIREGAWAGETAFLAPNGTEVPMSQVIVVSKDANGEAQLVSTIARDISERKEVERVKGEFVSTVSHELRTPLTSIRGSLGLLASGALGKLPEQALAMVDLGLGNSERLIRLVNNILDFERAEAGRLDLSPTEVDVEAIIDNTRESVDGAATEAGIAISVDLPTDLESVWCDEDRMVQVLVNLLGNGLKFSPRGGTVALAVSQTSEETVFEVADSGPGIPPEEIGSIFEPFHQVDSSDTREVGGTGLGLAIAKSIVSAHGGEIDVEATLGVGSTFRVHLPVTSPGSPTDRCDDEADAERELDSRDATATAADVLLADPDASTRIVVGQMLTDRGLTWAEASSGEAVLRQVAHLEPRLLMLDVTLPGVDGFEVVAQLRSRGHGSLPLIIYSDCDLGPDERARLALGPTRHLVKAAVSERDLIDDVITMLSSEPVVGKRRHDNGH